MFHSTDGSAVVSATVFSVLKGITSLMASKRRLKRQRLALIKQAVEVTKDTKRQAKVIKLPKAERRRLAAEERWRQKEALMLKEGDDFLNYMDWLLDQKRSTTRSTR